ncbi:hypothetical protein [Klebsiella pneumoniae]|uniref:hypothetical protein n=1 Tax=Klebsiella pneumoniae TaxID=573 RepID=UPI00388DC97F
MIVSIFTALTDTGCHPRPRCRFVTTFQTVTSSGCSGFVSGPLRDLIFLAAQLRYHAAFFTHCCSIVFLCLSFVEPLHSNTALLTVADNSAALAALPPVIRPQFHVALP